MKTCTFFQNYVVGGPDGGQLQLIKNGVGMSYSRGYGLEVNLFGTAILDLVVGDKVSPFNCMMQ